MLTIKMKNFKALLQSNKLDIYKLQIS